MRCLPKAFHAEDDLSGIWPEHNWFQLDGTMNQGIQGKPRHKQDSFTAKFPYTKKIKL